VEFVIAALTGMILGSFWNVCIHRLPRDQSLVNPPRSACPHCQTMIRAADNIPLVSFLMLGGKARCCGAAIPWRYPLVELLMTVFCVVAVAQHGVSAAAVKQAVFHGILLVLFFSDLAQMLLPDEFTLGGALAGLALAWWVPAPLGLADFTMIRIEPRWKSVINASGAGAVFGGFFWLVSEVYYRLRGRDGLGLGDVKMMLMLGAFLGLYQTAVTIFFASVLGAVVGIAVIAIQRSDYRTTEIPFGCFLAAAAWGVSMFGPQLPF
jgi:leader peptidase (prepilin peptidase)/N-methyltransferase